MNRCYCANAVGHGSKRSQQHRQGPRPRAFCSLGSGLIIPSQNPQTTVCVRPTGPSGLLHQGLLAKRLSAPLENKPSPTRHSFLPGGEDRLPGWLEAKIWHIGTYLDVNIFSRESSWEVRSCSCLSPGSRESGPYGSSSSCLPSLRGREGGVCRPDSVSTCRGLAAPGGVWGDGPGPTLTLTGCQVTPQVGHDRA